MLSAELLAIRQTLASVGSGTNTVSIIIAAILMPLAFGYYAGGQFRGKIRNKLLRNLLIAGTFLTLGLSYFILTWFFATLTESLEWKNRLVLMALYVVLFLITPVYLLGQAVPLVSNYFRRAYLLHAAGRILFFSTIGSFLGAVLTTLFLMNTIGVSGTVIVTITCIAVLILLLSKFRIRRSMVAPRLLLLLAIGLNSSQTLYSVGMISDNAYNTVQLEDYGDTRYLRLNRSYASAIYPENPEYTVFEYVRYMNMSLLIWIRI